MLGKKCLSALAAGLLLWGCGESRPEFEEDSVILGVNYVGVSVADIEAAERYYLAAMGVKTVSDEPLVADNFLAPLLEGDDASAETRLIRSANAQLRLMAFANPSAHGQATAAVPVNGPGLAHVCFQAAQKTNIYRNALEAGAKPIGAKELVTLSSRNPVKYGYITDPLGIITEIEEVDVAALELPEPPKNDYRMRHVAFATPDLESMVQFYSAFLGGQKPRRIGNWFHLSGEAIDKVSGLKDAEIEMAWFQLRNLELEFGQYYSHPVKRPTKARPLDAPGYNMIVFDVSSIEKARKRLEDAGGTIVTPIGMLDDGRIVFGRDPDGNLIGLQELPASSIYSAKNFADNGV